MVKQRAMNIQNFITTLQEIEDWSKTMMYKLFAGNYDKIVLIILGALLDMNVHSL